MSIVAVEFAEAPVVRTWEDLHTAAERLAIENYACVIDPDPDLREWMADMGPGIADATPVLQGLKIALVGSTQHIRWDFARGADNHRSGLPNDFRVEPGSPSYVDHGLHTDPLGGEQEVSVRCHLTTLGEVEATFAISTEAYAASRREEDYLTGLLRRGLTDTHLVVRESFRRVRLSEGDSVAFAVGGPGRLAQ